MRAIWCAPSCLLFLLGCAASLEEPGAAAGGCSPCVPDECSPLPAWGCPLGKVRDNCGCCWRCARGEGEACGNGVSGGVTVVWGRCATGLECRRRTKSRGATAVCVCKSRYPVCGSDGLTYPSTCQLRAASLRAKSRGERPVEQRSKGPCEQGPSIVTPPKDIWNVSGAQVYLSCEVIGVPTPILTWNKPLCCRRCPPVSPSSHHLSLLASHCHHAAAIIVTVATIPNRYLRFQHHLSIGSIEARPPPPPRRSKAARTQSDQISLVGAPRTRSSLAAAILESLSKEMVTRGQYSVQRVELLPGDRDNLAVQTRGGPEKHEVTGWVLISPLSKDDAGEYECHASNSKGEATASGKITVVNSLNEIPAKGESTEL